MSITLLGMKRAIAHSSGVRRITDALWPSGRLATVQDGVLRGRRLMVPVFSGAASYARGEYEATEVELVRRLVLSANVGTFCDVGAHVGYYSVLVSTLLSGDCSIHAFEPSPESFTCLAHNLAHCCPGGFRIHCEAVGETVGTAEFLGHGGGVANSLADYRPSQYRSGPGRTVSVTTLDVAVAAHGVREPVLVKVDVEGAEAAVLRGSERLLREVAPMWVIECHSPDLLHEVCDILYSSRYSVYTLASRFSSFPHVLALSGEAQVQNRDCLQWALGSGLVQDAKEV